MTEKRRRESSPWPMPEAMKHIPKWANSVVIEYPDGNQYAGNVNRLAACWKTAMANKEWSLRNGETEAKADCALFRIVKFLE